MSQIVLITGLNGFLAIHVAKHYLEKGWKVRGTVRTQQTAEKTLKLDTLREYNEKGLIEIAIVSDIVNGDYTEALKGVEGVVHLASPNNVTGKTWSDYKTPAVLGSLNILRQASEIQSIKAVCICSSFVAMCQVNIPYWEQKDKKFGPDSFIPITEEECEKLDASNPYAGFIWYCASKKFADIAANEWYAKTRPNWSLSTVCPPLIFGSPLEVETAEEFNKASGFSTAFLKSNLIPEDKKSPQSTFSAWADVGDVSTSIFNSIQGRHTGRYPIISGHYDPILIARAAINYRPDLKEFFPQVSLDGPIPLDQGTYTVDTSSAETELGIKWTPLEKMVANAVDRYEKIGVFAK